jgi:flagellar basal-body rod protein FlgC
MSDAFDIAASGMAAHRAQLDVIAENLANANSVGANGAPYRARTALIEPLETVADPLDGGDFSFADALDAATGDSASDAFFDLDVPAQPAAVRVAGIVDSASGPRGSASAAGVDPIGQMVELLATGRAYDADVAALQAAKQMDVEAVDVDRS